MPGPKSWMKETPRILESCRSMTVPKIVCLTNFINTLNGANDE